MFKAISNLFGYLLKLLINSIVSCILLTHYNILFGKSVYLVKINLVFQ